MFDTAFGLPLHPLVVHAVVVFLPLASLAVLLAAVWPKFRRWAGPAPLILAVAGTALVPVATESGEWFRSALDAGANTEVQRHAALGDLMLYWGIGLIIAAAAVFWLHLQTRSTTDGNRKPSRLMVAAVIVVAAVASAGTVVHIVRVGDSGARAAWGYLTESAN